MQKGIFINFDSEKVPSVTVLVASGSRTVKNGMTGYLIYGENMKITDLIFRIRVGSSDPLLVILGSKKADFWMERLDKRETSLLSY